MTTGTLEEEEEEEEEQGRIHGQYQSRTGGQGRKCTFSHFPTRSPRTDRPTDRPTDGRTDEASYRVASPRLKKAIIIIV